MIRKKTQKSYCGFVFILLWVRFFLLWVRFFIPTETQTRNKPNPIRLGCPSYYLHCLWLSPSLKLSLCEPLVELLREIPVQILSVGIGPTTGTEEAIGKPTPLPGPGKEREDFRTERTSLKN